MNGDWRLTSCIWLQVYPFKGRFGISEHDYKLIPPILRKRTLSDSSLRLIIKNQANRQTFYHAYNRNVIADLCHMVDATLTRDLWRIQFTALKDPFCWTVQKIQLNSANTKQIVSHKSIRRCFLEFGMRESIDKTRLCLSSQERVNVEPAALYRHFAEQKNKNKHFGRAGWNAPTWITINLPNGQTNVSTCWEKYIFHIFPWRKFNIRIVETVDYKDSWKRKAKG